MENHPLISVSLGKYVSFPTRKIIGRNDLTEY